MKIGIIGGTGPAGQAIARRLGVSGHEVLVGSRDATRSATIVNENLAAWKASSLQLIPGTNAEAALCDVSVLATPWDGAVSTALGLAAELEGKVLISMVNALARVGNEFQALVPARGSIAASLQGVLPNTKVTTAFQHLPAKELGAIDVPFEAEVMVCSDDADGFDRTAEVVSTVEGLRAVFCGSLASANAIEALTAVLLNINIKYKSHVTVRLVGLRENG